MRAVVDPKSRVKPGDLVTDRFGSGAEMFQNVYTWKMRSVRMQAGEIGLVTRIHSAGVTVLFKGEEWLVAPANLRVVKDEENQ
jgi:hypothetical protein